MIELERTYLAKYLPKNLEKCKKEEILDIYIPKSAFHPVLRIRKRGEEYKITKKEPIKGNASVQKEQTINLSREEFEALSKIDGKKLRKLRYYYPHEERGAEIDVFLGKLRGLVLVDFEFESKEQMERFKMPEFCLVEVSNEKFAAGGMLCGKSYEEIEEELNRLKYKRIEYKNL